MSETWEKYGLGVVAATLVAALAIKCIGWGVAYLPKLPFLPGRVTVSGQSGLFANLAYLAMAGFIFSRFFLNNALKSTSGQAVAYFFQVVTLVLFIAIFALALSGIVVPGL